MKTLYKMLDFLYLYGKIRFVKVKNGIIFAFIFNLSKNVSIKNRGALMVKRFFSLAAATAIAGMTLVGCSGNTAESGGKVDSNNDSVETVTKDTEEKVVITYANWNLGTEEENNLERRMIAEYMERNPHVEIKIAENIDTAQYLESLTTAAAAGNLPDVIMLQNIPTPLSNEWLMDISSLVEGDEDWAKIAQPVVETTMHSGNIYAMPAGQYFCGYYLNTDLFEQENIRELEFGYTLEEFENAIKSVTSLNKGIIGLEDETSMIDWYAGLSNDDLGWFTWDGEKYNLDSVEFKDSLNKARELATGGYVYGALSAEEQQNFKGTNGYEAWIEGEVAFKYDGTWAAQGMSELPFNTKFVGLPNSKTVIVNDYMGVSKNAENAEEAYEFAKWMTFSKEGTLARIDIAEENDLVYGSLPIINDEELLERYFEYNMIDGVEEIYAEIDNAIVETFKSTPGYENSRWHATTGLKVGDIENITIGDLVFNCFRGTANIEDYATQLNELANQKFEEANAAIN